MWVRISIQLRLRFIDTLISVNIERRKWWMYVIVPHVNREPLKWLKRTYPSSNLDSSFYRESIWKQKSQNSLKVQIVIRLHAKAKTIAAIKLRIMRCKNRRVFESNIQICESTPVCYIPSPDNFQLRGLICWRMSSEKSKRKIFPTNLLKIICS